MRQIPEDIRSRLFEAAAREFAAKRFEGASLNQILEQAQVSKGRFYYYFTDKAALFGAVLENMFSEFSAGMDQVARAKSPEEFWAAMEVLVEEGWRAYAEDSVLRALSHQALEMASQVGHPVQVFLQGLLEQVHGLLEAGSRLGAIRQDMDLTLLTSLLAAIDTAADRWLMSRLDETETPDLSDLTRYYMDLYKRLLLPRSLLLEFLSSPENRGAGEPSFEQGGTKRKRRPPRRNEKRNSR